MVFTALIGALPTRRQVGVAAPVLLTLLRVCQGLALGGELSVSMVISLPTAVRTRLLA